jgi:hypothetical protein
MTSMAVDERRDQSHEDRQAGRLTLRRVMHENGLSIVVFLIFVACWGMQIIFGLREYNQEQHDHNQPQVTLGQYLTTGHFVEATAENWESEFLQMAAFVWFTAFLFQKGSPESRDPYEEPEKAPLTEKSPWPARKGGLMLAVYARSLTIAFLLMFLISFWLHALGGTWLYNEEQLAHHEEAVSVWQFMGRSEFWFQSMQNWQSEFLSILAMVVLAIFLRQQGSPESKPVNTPHSENE